MRVGDCESYAKIINWNRVHRNERKRTHSRRHVSRHVTFVSTMVSTCL